MSTLLGLLLCGFISVYNKTRNKTGCTMQMALLFNASFGDGVENSENQLFLCHFTTKEIKIFS